MSKRMLSFFRTWWQTDRIRLSPAQGRLLCIEPMSLVRIAGEWFQVRNRRIDPERNRIVYQCHDVRREGTLRVAFTSMCDPPSIEWCIDQSRRMLSEPDIDVYPPTVP